MKTRAIVGVLGIGGLLAWAFYARQNIGAQFDSIDDLNAVGDEMITSKIQAVAGAIGLAEGANVPGSIPNRDHNPGDMKLGGHTEPNGITIFDNDQEGESALERQLGLIASGQSHVYTLSMTIAEMAEKYTGADNAGAWASIVAGRLGVSVDTPLSEVLL